MPADPPALRYAWILRHARARPGGSGSDRERPLSPEGLADATALGARLGPGGDRLGLASVALPALVVCSPALRTRQTAEAAIAGLSPAPRLVVLPELYGASPGAIGALVDQAASSDPLPAQAVMVVGHNPSMAQLVAGCLRGDDRAGATHLGAAGFPPGALAVLQVPTRPAPRGGPDLLGPDRAVLLGLFTPPYAT